MEIRIRTQNHKEFQYELILSPDYTLMFYGEGSSTCIYICIPARNPSSSAARSAHGGRRRQGGAVGARVGNHTHFDATNPLLFVVRVGHLGKIVPSRRDQMRPPEICNSGTAARVDLRVIISIVKIRCVPA